MTSFSTGLHAERQGRQAVGDQIDPEQLDRHERRFPPQQYGQEYREDLAKVAGEEELDGFADIVVNPPPFFDGGDDGGEVVVGQGHVRRALGYVGAGDPHGAADIRRF